MVGSSGSGGITGHSCFWCGSGSERGGERFASSGSTEPETGIVDRTVEIGALAGDSFGDSCIGKFDPSDSVKICPKIFLACQTLAWFASGCSFVQLKIAKQKMTKQKDEVEMVSFNEDSATFNPSEQSP